MSKLDIIEHGGSVDQIYSASITHVICTTQKHHIVEQVKIMLIFQYKNIIVDNLIFSLRYFFRV